MDFISVMVGAMATQFLLMGFYFFIFKKIEFLNLMLCGMSMLIFTLFVVFPEIAEVWQRYGLSFTIEVRNVFVFLSSAFFYAFVRKYLSEENKHAFFCKVMRFFAIVFFITAGLYAVRNLLGETAQWIVGFFYFIYFANYLIQAYVVVYLLLIRDTRVRLVAIGTLFMFVVIKIALIPNYRAEQLDTNLTNVSIFSLLGLTVNFLFFTFSLIYGFWMRSKEIARLDLERTMELHQQRVDISNDLHDDLGATLSSLHIYSSIAKKYVEENPVKAKENLDLISTNVFTLMEKINDVIWSVSTKQSNVSLLSTRIKDCFVNIFDAAGIKCTYEIDENTELIITGLKARKLLLLFAKESINNAIKHSGASEMRFSMQQSNGNLVMSIEDNGKGIGDLDFTKGNGLTNLKHRADQLNGHFSIETLKPKGTLVECMIPLTNISL